MDALAPGGTTAASYLVGMLHPAAGMLLASEKTSEYPDVNAPTGLREILNIFLQETASGDIQVPYALGRQFNPIGVVAPYLQDYLNLGGINSDPRAQAKLGINNQDGVDLGERVRAGALTLGRAAGVQVQTPADALGPYAQSRDMIDDLIARMKAEGRILPGE